MAPSALKEVRAHADAGLALLGKKLASRKLKEVLRGVRKTPYAVEKAGGQLYAGSASNVPLGSAGSESQGTR